MSATNHTKFESIRDSIEEKAIKPLFDYLDGELQRPVTTEGYIKIYTLVYNECTGIESDTETNKKGLYKLHQDTIKRYLNGKKESNKKGEYLEYFVLVWGKFKLLNKWMKMFLCNLDRWYIPENHLRSLETSGYFLFVTDFLFHTRDELYKEAIQKINMRREDDTCDLGNVIIFLEVLDTLDNYCCCSNGEKSLFEDFEILFVDHSRIYYASLALLTGSKIGVCCSSSEYLEFVRIKMKKELSLLQYFIPRRSIETKIQEIMENELLVEHYKEIILDVTSGCRFLLNEGNLKHIAEMFRLYIGVKLECLTLMSSNFSEYILDMGNKLTENLQKAIQGGDSKDSLKIDFISSIYRLLKNVKTTTKDCFQNHILFERVLECSFKKVLSGPLLAEYLTLYFHNYLGRCSEKVTDEERHKTLVDALSLFGYVEDKDHFLNLYRHFLAKRLLSKKSYSTDLERVVINELRLCCGVQYTSRLEGMIYDSETNNETFKEYIMENSPEDTNFSVRTLTQTFWPVIRVISCSLPNKIYDSQKKYETFYSQRFSGRKLEWMHSLGTVDIDAHFFPAEKKTAQKKYLISMNTFQSLVILQFNSSISHTISSLSLTTEIPENELKQILDSLTLQRRCHLLLKDDCDVYRINETFTSNLKWVKLPPFAFQREKKSTSEHLSGRSMEMERNSALDASIIRILKTRKRLSHSDLVEEVTRQMTIMFHPTMKTIKCRVESLIERDFMSRDPESPSIYTYII